MYCPQERGPLANTAFKKLLVVGSFTLSLERQKEKGVLHEVQTTRFCGQNL